MTTVNTNGDSMANPRFAIGKKKRPTSNVVSEAFSWPKGLHKPNNVTTNKPAVPNDEALSTRP